MRNLTIVNDVRVRDQHGFLSERLGTDLAGKPDAPVRGFGVTIEGVPRFKRATAVRAGKPDADVLALMMLPPSVEVSILGQTERASEAPFSVDDFLVTLEHGSAAKLQLALFAFHLESLVHGGDMLSEMRFGKNLVAFGTGEFRRFSA